MSHFCVCVSALVCPAFPTHIGLTRSIWTSLTVCVGLLAETITWAHTLEVSTTHSIIKTLSTVNLTNTPQLAPFFIHFLCPCWHSIARGQATNRKCFKILSWIAREGIACPLGDMYNIMDSTSQRITVSKYFGLFLKLATLGGRCSSCYRRNPQTHHSSTSFPCISNSLHPPPLCITSHTQSSEPRFNWRTHAAVPWYFDSSQELKRIETGGGCSIFDLCMTTGSNSVCDRKIQSIHILSAQRLIALYRSVTSWAGTPLSCKWANHQLERRKSDSMSCRV